MGLLNSRFNYWFGVVWLLLNLAYFFFMHNLEWLIFPKYYMLVLTYFSFFIVYHYWKDFKIDQLIIIIFLVHLKTGTGELLIAILLCMLHTCYEWGFPRNILPFFISFVVVLIWWVLKEWGKIRMHNILWLVLVTIPSS